MSSVMTEWQSIEFPGAIRKVKVGRENQIFASDIMSSGQYPVVDQGQAFIVATPMLRIELYMKNSRW